MKKVELLETIKSYDRNNPHIFGEKGDILQVTKDEGSRIFVKGKNEIFPVAKNQCKEVK